jgi:hypothetical protein
MQANQSAAPGAALGPATWDVTTWYLEMRRPEDLRGGPAPAGDIAVVRAGIPSPEFSRFLYSAVGRGWHWTDRLAWDDDRWRRYLSQPEVERSRPRTWRLCTSACCPASSGGASAAIC